MNLFLNILLLHLFASSPVASYQTAATGMVKITFVNKVKDQKLALNEATYTNPSQETYTVRKFKYYITQVAVEKKDGWKAEKKMYHLVDESKPGSLSFSFPVPAGNYASVRFLLGVDSLENVSGAQTGALDPLNDMFWTWNTGYVAAKLEAVSPQAKSFRQKVEYHIGGFKGADNVSKHINLSFKDAGNLVIKKGKSSEIVIDADIDKWWGPNQLSIAETPACNAPGKLALSIADNYSTMFSISKIINR
jgi:hypothetical protein